MKKQLQLLFLTALCSSTAFSQSNKAKEIELIKSMAGTYKVDFKFTETFAPVKDYKYWDKKFEWANEYVTIVEETPNKISLQHLLIINDSIIIKHWRQDWVYEADQYFVYDKDNTWKKVKVPKDKVKGTWTQKVYQVDDGPRYEGYGTWVHVDGRHYWESVTDAPLPRREHTIRNDYNVLNRTSHIEIYPDGSWVLDQDNKKIARVPSGDSLVCMEKGIEYFTPSKVSAQSAIKYWEKEQLFWKDVRTAWDEISKKFSTISIAKRVDDKLLFEVLFALAEKYSSEKKYDAVNAKLAIKETLSAFVMGE